MRILQRASFWHRIGLCTLAVAIMWISTAGWNPPFIYRVGYTPSREICARVPFEFFNKVETDEARAKAKGSALTYYANNVSLLEEVRQGLNDQLFRIKGAESYTPETAAVWKEFFAEKLPTDDVSSVNQPVADEKTFQEFRDALAKDQNLEKLKHAVDISLMDFRKTGLLKNLEHGLGEGSTQELMVFPKGNPEDARRVDVAAVRIGEVDNQLLERLRGTLKNESDTVENYELVAQRVFQWIRPHLPVTLTLDQNETKRSKELAAKDVPLVMFKYRKGDKLTYRKDDSSSGGIEGGEPLDPIELEILKTEHNAYLANRTVASIFAHSLADLGMYGALFLLAGCYLSFRQPDLIRDLRKFILILSCLVAAVLTSYWVSILASPWRPELIPVMFFALAISIAYRHDVAWVLSSVVAMICAFSLGIGLTGFIILIAGATSASFLTGRVRSRTKLVYVGFASTVIVMPTVIGVTVLDGQPFTYNLLIESLWFGFCSIVAALLMTALLPFVEKVFDVQTDLTLLELGDAAHPLLQELVQRAPGTYNHSINVGSLSEAAAEAIGANGLLCRVSAYFHDIGKMRKPEYFVENQGSGGSKHDRLVPAMSTLVIIAHVKDGVELAKQYHLPRVIIDFIEQHHGTTLVEYFYDQATRQCEEDEDVDEANFRYPGPRPQTKEACVMMVADAVESASRTLVDPAPSRIENLVHDIAMKRLHDGQFDECGITLKELSLIEQSLVKSITATYHSRIKYPHQQEKQQTA